jgi:peptidoglycan hydrolase CwlO-like protein
MRFRSHHASLRHAAVTAAVLGVLSAVPLLPVASAAAPSLGDLQNQLANQQSRQQQLSHSIGGLSQSVSALDAQINLVQSRIAAVRVDLAHDRAELRRVSASLGRERARVRGLRAALAWARKLLARQLVSSYEGGQPNLVSVVLDANGFADLLERFTFLRDAESAQQRIIGVTRRAKTLADREAARLAKLQRSDRQLANGAALRERALAGMNALLGSKQAALASALAAQRRALAASQGTSASLRHQIAHIQAEQAAAAAAAAAAARAPQPNAPTGSSSGPALGPSGGWAIPYAIVLCESGGQNLPPNSAGASGYYQIMPATWKLFGGTGPAAYLASKGEQDSVASRIWNGGAGASNWVCAGIVGIH